MTRTWILYDQRAIEGDTFAASVLDTTSDPSKVRPTRRGIWFEYDQTDDKHLINERLAEHPVTQEPS